MDKLPRIRKVEYLSEGDKVYLWINYQGYGYLDTSPRETKDIDKQLRMWIAKHLSEGKRNRPLKCRSA
jgi:hypothetical protein